MKTLRKINQFYVLMMVVFIVLAVFAAIGFRGIFSAMSLAGEIDESLLASSSPRLDVSKLNKALESAKRSDVPTLDL